MSNAEQKRSLYIFPAKSSRGNSETPAAEQGRDLLTPENSPGGYFSPRCHLSRDVDMNAVLMDRALGMVEFEVEWGGSESGWELLEPWCQRRTQVTVVYRELEQMEGIWREKKAMTLQGLVSRVKVHAGFSCISLDAHAMQITRNGKSGRCLSTPASPSACSGWLAGG